MSDRNRKEGINPAVCMSGWSKRHTAVAVILALALALAGGCGGGGSSSTSQAPVGPNQAPVITVANALTVPGGSPGSTTLQLSDDRTPAGNPVVGVTSNNPGLFASRNIAVAGSGGRQTLNFTPTQDSLGDATLSIVVSDGDNGSSTTVLRLSVVAQERALGAFVRETFVLEPNSEPRLINALSLVETSGGDDFSDLISP